MGEKKKEKEIHYPLDAAIEVQLVSILKAMKKTITTAESITGTSFRCATLSIVEKGRIFLSSIRLPC